MRFEVVERSGGGGDGREEKLVLEGDGIRASMLVRRGGAPTSTLVRRGGGALKSTEYFLALLDWEYGDG